MRGQGWVGFKSYPTPDSERISEGRYSDKSISDDILVQKVILHVFLKN